MNHVESTITTPEYLTITNERLYTSTPHFIIKNQTNTMKSTKYQCLEDRVLIRPIKKKETEKTDSGIILDMVEKEVSEGEVVNVGAGKYAPETGEFIPTVLGCGDIVLYGVHAGMPLDVPNEDGKKEVCRIMREGDVLCLIKKESPEKQ